MAARIVAALTGIAVLLVPAAGAMARHGGISSLTPPAISGNGVVGSTLTASTGTWTGSPTSYAYTWHRCNSAGRSCSLISGATAATYGVASDDVGHTLKVRVQASNSLSSASAPSAVTPVVQLPLAPVQAAPVAPSNTAVPVVSGSVQVGQTLSTSNGAWSGTAPIGYSYKWEDCDSSGASCAAIAGAAASSYVLASGDQGHTIRAVVTASNSVGSASASSAATGSVSAAPAQAPANTAAPSVSGTAQVGQTLSSTAGSWSGTAPIGYAYKWQDCDSSGANCAAIAGATSSTYQLVSGDQGHTIRSVVTASNSAGSASASSTQTAAVQTASPPPSGQMVMAFDLGWDPTSNMPWSDLTQADLFNLETENGPGLDASNIAGINIAAWVSAAHAHNVQAIISIGGSDDQNWQNACNDTNRAQFVTNLVNYATSHSFNGIDLDIEDNAWLSVGPPTAAMTTCIEAVATAAHAAGLIVAADVITNWAGTWFGPSQSYVDQFNLMTYGDDLATLNSDVQDTFNQGLPYNKMVVGVDVADYPEPSGGCGPYATYAAQHNLKGSFVWAAQPDTANICMNALAAG